MAAFRLQSVLDLKQRLENVQQQELGALAQQRHLAEEALQLLALQARQQQDALAERVQAGRLDTQEVTAALAYIDGVRATIAAQRDLALELEARIQQSRERLVDISRERHVLERLRERHVAAEALEADRRDQRAADELVGQRYARKAWEV